MRFLFFVPLGIKRNLNATADMATALGRLGHDSHIFTREVTRVNLNGSFVLSRNQSNVQELKNRIGEGNVSCFHSNLETRDISTESVLMEADREIVQAFVHSYRPDAVFIYEEELVAKDLMTQAAHLNACGTLKLTIQLSADRRNLILNNGEKAIKLPRGNHRHMAKEIRDRLLLDINPQTSLANLRKTLKEGNERLGKLKQNEFHKIFPAQPLVKINTPEEQRGQNEVSGELESVKNADVIFGETLWLKGWIDFSDQDLNSISIRVNANVYQCFPGTVRGELAERFKNPNIFGFDTRIPLEGEGTQLHVRLGLRYKSGYEREWKSFFLWNNDSVPRRYKSPTLTGEAVVSQKNTNYKITGQLNAEGYQINRIRTMQCGVELGAWESPADKKASIIEFCFDLLPSINTKQPVHLWVNLDGETWIYWMHCPAVEQSLKTMALSVTGISEGQVIRGKDLTIGIRSSDFKKQVKIYLNGMKATEVMVDCNLTELKLPLGNVGNDLYIELATKEYDYAAYQLWRHLEEPLTRKTLTAVTVPYKSLKNNTLKGDSVGKRKLLLIRKTAAPTDELYVLAPLQPLIEQGLVEVNTVDLTSMKLNPQLVDNVLQPGTFVVVSRYISDDWIQVLTTKKKLLAAIFYLMDDDVLAAEETPWLSTVSTDYRSRMAQVAHGEFQTMVNLCDRLVVTSEFLANRYSSLKTRLLEPPYINQPRDMLHFAKQPLIIAYHGTLTHRDDLAMIAPALRHIHDRYAHVRLQVVMGTSLPDYLKGLKRVEIVRAMPWEDYKSFAASSRAHIAVAPMLRTPYNLGKSIIKIHDIASLGAAGLFTRCEPYTKYISDQKDGLLLENDPLMWEKAMRFLIENPDKAQALAIAGQSLAQSIGSLERLTKFWATEMGIRR